MILHVKHRYLSADILNIWLKGPLEAQFIINLNAIEKLIYNNED